MKTLEWQSLIRRFRDIGDEPDYTVEGLFGDQRAQFAKLATKNTPFPQSIIRIITGYLLGPGVIVNPAEPNKKVLAERIENLIGSETDFNIWLKNLITMFIQNGAAYIWPRNERTYLQLVPSREIVDVFRDKNGKITYYRRRYVEKEYASPQTTASDVYDQIVVDSKVKVIDIPADEIFRVAMFVDDETGLPYGGIESLASAFGDHLKMTELLSDTAYKNATYGLQAVLENASRSKITQFAQVLREQLGVDPKTGARRFSAGQIITTPVELKPVSFDKSNEINIRIGDELEKQIVSALGMSPSLLWNLNANLATALAQQNPTYRSMIEMQREVSFGIRRAVAYCLTGVSPDDIEVIMPDPVMLAKKELAEVVIHLYEAGLMSKKEAVYALNYHDAKRAEKSLALIEAEPPKHQGEDNEEKSSLGKLSPERPDMRKKHSAGLPQTDV